MMKVEDTRKKENQDLIERMRKGESLARCRPQDTWFQPRPIIKKDLEAMKKLEQMNEHQNRSTPIHGELSACS
jgi:ribosomal protein L19E